MALWMAFQLQVEVTRAPNLFYLLAAECLSGKHPLDWRQDLIGAVECAVMVMAACYHSHANDIIFKDAHKELKRIRDWAHAEQASTAQALALLEQKQQAVPARNLAPGEEAEATLMHGYSMTLKKLVNACDECLLILFRH